MRLLKFLLGLVVLLGLVLVVGGFLLPRQTHVERSIVIDRPAAEVYAVVNSYRRFREWSPWSEQDPQAKYEFTGPDAGVGARMTWAGNERVGTGSQEIIASEPDRKVVNALDFGGNKGTGTFTLTPEGEGTRVVWGFDADHGNDPLSRWFGLLFDKMIGPDYERGLGRLKRVVEGQ